MKTDSNLQQTIRIAIVEDEASFVDRLLANLAGTAEVQVVSVVGTVADGLALLHGPACDVMLVDLGLPDGSGLDIVRAVHGYWPKCNVMVSTAFGDEAHVIQSIEAGATGYLLKDDHPSKMIEEIRNLVEGGSPISPLIARKILLRLQPSQPSSPSTVHAMDVLSPREAEVLGLITKGYTAEEIGRLLSVSHNTVLTFIRRIYRKLEVTSKAEAIFEAKQRGIVR